VCCIDQLNPPPLADVRKRLLSGVSISAADDNASPSRIKQAAMPEGLLKPLPIGSSYSVRFSPDSRLLATVGRHVVLWSLEERRRIAHARPFKHPSWIDFSPMGDRLAVKSTAGHICILAVPDLALLVEFDGRGASEGNQISFSPCGDYLIDSDWKGRLVVRDARTGEFVHQEQFPDTMIQWFAARADRQAFAFGPFIREPAIDGSPCGMVACRTWPLSDVETPTLNVGATSVDLGALSADGTAVALLIPDEHPLHRLLLLEQRGTGWSSREAMVSHSGGTSKAIAWSPDGRRLALTQDHSTSIFDVSTLARVAHHPLPYPCDVAWSPDGRLLALGSWSKGVVMGAGSVGELALPAASSSQEPAREPGAADALEELKTLIQRAKARR
jgi:WD40 repeat protein